MDHFTENLPSLSKCCSKACLESITQADLSKKLLYKEALPHPHAYLDVNQRHKALHSRRPLEEAQRLITHWLGDSQQPRTIGLIGVSSYFIIEELLNTLPGNSTLLIIEPEVEFLKSFLSHTKLNSLFEHKVTTKIIYAKSTNDIKQLFRKEITDTPILIDGLFIPPSLERLRPQLLDLKKALTAQVRLDAMDRITVASFADEWMQNCLINLPEISQSPGIRTLLDKFKNSCAVILCAGPSLNASLQYIRQHQHQYLIIAVGTALKPALAAGIKPHLTIALDSDPKVFRQFLGIQDPPGYLLASYTLFPAIYQLYGKRVLPFNCPISVDFAAWLRTSGYEHGFLNVGGTVSLSAIDCAIRLGCHKLFVFGLDLSFATDGTTHATNSMYQDEKICTGLVEVKGNRHKTVKTTQQFANYIEIIKSYLNDVFVTFSGKMFNINNAGAYIQGMELISPEEFDQYPHPQDKQSYKEFIASQVTSPEKDLNELYRQTISSLGEICQQGKELLDELKHKSIPDGLEDYESKILNNTQLLTPALKAWCMSVEGHNSQQDSMKMTSNFVSQTHGAAEWVKGLLELSHQRYNKQAEGVNHG